MKTAAAALLAAALLAPQLRAEEQPVRAGAGGEGFGHLTLMDDVRLRFTGYVDAGFFAAQGDGTAYVRDAGKLLHPEYQGVVPWVFLGDPWGNPINSQGDSADLGLDRTNIPRFDPIHSGGHPSFIVNMVNLGMAASIGSSFFFETSVGFEPRQGTLGSSGDQFDVDLAYVEWVPFKTVDLHVFAGKFESTFGIEYRTRKAPDRFGVTPSLISRYTVGELTGLKVRGSFFDQHLTFNLAVSNGGTFTEKFAHFFNEVDFNGGKTLSGRVSVLLPLPFTAEIGASGEIGAEDEQRSDSTVQWLGGVDLRVSIGDATLKAELLRGHADGGGIDQAASLRVTGWYGELQYQLLPWLGLLGRVDRRKADLLAFPNLYLTDELRYTGGLRFDVSWNVIAKLEYAKLVEVTGPEIPDDLFTSSFIFKF
ncbi:MAG TPA: hypothetical protein VE964_07305 [Myxococcales bacterium]|nr:hypothetical protein [Myxococcales bacterium]